MITRTLFAALVAGVLAGVLVTPIQQAKVVPLIVAAEVYETGGAPHGHAAALMPLIGAAHAHSPAAADEAGGTTLVESRLGGTLLANIVLGAGFALILLAVSLLVDRPITARNGAIWGLAGFGVLTLAPALGLPPELPAMPAADLVARQLWWLTTVAATAGGLYALVLLRVPLARGAGLGVMVLPHLFAAPHPADLASPIPPTLAAEFAVASLATSALLWLAIGLIAGVILDRMRQPAALRPA